MKKVSVLGLGRAGMACARLLKNKGFEVFGSDIKETIDMEFVRQARTNMIEIETGGNTERVLDADMIVVSPGISLSHPILEKARRKSIPIVGELEVAFWFTESKIVGVTGTNGKTLTTYLINEILKAAGVDSVVGGNVGIPLASIVESARKDSILVVEISSFQLETIEKFRPYIGVFLNISEDHLDRYKSFEEYRDTKARLFINQGENDFGVFNFEDKNVVEISNNVRSKKKFFSKKREKDGWIKEGNVFVIEGEEICGVDEIPLNFECIWDDILASLLVCSILGVKKENMREGLISFKGVPHRLEFVTARDGIKFINNSMCTNPVAFVNTLYSFKEKPILIAGGKEKGMDLTQIARAIKERVKYCVLIGEVKEKLRKAIVEKQNASPRIVMEAESIESAVELAFSRASKGDIILLSPGFASFDQFRDFAERGERFKKAIKRLKD